MQAQRIKFLQEEIESFPEDPFNYYALALEYKSTNIQKAKELFNLLLERFPEYLPIYYQAANFFFEINDIEKADKLFLDGIQLSTLQENEKTLKELKSSYSLFKSEIDDEF